VLAGTLSYDLPSPFIPGPACIGRVEKFGADVFDLSPGQLVLCNSLLSSGDVEGSVDDILVGWTGTGSARSARMQEVWRNGSFAEKALYPARCLTTLPGADTFDVTRLAFLAPLAIADGGLRRGDLRGGQTLVINGATGQLGSAAVLMALGRWVDRIVVTGRDEKKLQALAALSPRIVVCRFTGDRAADGERLTQLTEGGSDLTVDYLAHTPDPSPTLCAIDATRIGGSIVLVGGVRHDLPLNYSTIMRRQLTLRGSFMFDRVTAFECSRMVRSGIDLSVLEPQTFRPDTFEAAMSAAEGLAGFRYAVLLPA
jgi:threonine dehydrogenase-like Zn-dependent dehydrogenase